MKKSFVLTALFFSLSFFLMQGQKIADGESVDLDGLNVTFNILNKESVTAGGKTFDRYKVSATVKNNTQKSFNIRLSNFPQIVTNNAIVELNCINATGAKLTSKKINLKMKPQLINVTYYSYDKDGKSVTSVIPVTASYYFDPGDTINDDAIFIVPQGEKPEVNVRKLL